MHYQEHGRNSVCLPGTYRSEQGVRIDGPCHSQLYRGAQAADLFE